MNDRPTPETLAVWRETLDTGGSWHIKPFAHACKLERERNEMRELYDLDTQTLRAERDEVRDALRVRIEQARIAGSDDPCGLCGRYIGHAKTCRHYQTEKEVMK